MSQKYPDNKTQNGTIINTIDHFLHITSFKMEAKDTKGLNKELIKSEKIRNLDKAGRKFLEEVPSLHKSVVKSSQDDLGLNKKGYGYELQSNFIKWAMSVQALAEYVEQANNALANCKKYSDQPIVQAFIEDLRKLHKLCLINADKFKDIDSINAHKEALSKLKSDLHDKIAHLNKRNIHNMIISHKAYTTMSNLIMPTILDYQDAQREIKEEVAFPLLRNALTNAQEKLKEKLEEKLEYKGRDKDKQLLDDISNLLKNMKKNPELSANGEKILDILTRLKQKDLHHLFENLISWNKNLSIAPLKDDLTYLQECTLVGKNQNKEFQVFRAFDEGIKYFMEHSSDVSLDKHIDQTIELLNQIQEKLPAEKQQSVSPRGKSPGFFEPQPKTEEEDQTQKNKFNPPQ